MAATGARVAQVVRAHIPQIKFPPRGAMAPVGKSAATLPTPTSTPTSTAKVSSSKPVGSTPRGSGIDYKYLPSKYKRKPIDQTEIDYIMRGGPE